MKRDIGPHGLALVKSYESFVPFVYDDLVIHNGKYVEWNGGPVRGTLTIGYGHTDVARHPLKCTLGTRITEEQALEVLHVDISEVTEAINKLVKVPLSQGQFDALDSFGFNCGVGNLKRLIVPLNNGDYDRCRGDFAHYVRSKGQVLRGLERRRAAEQALWDDRYEVAAAQHPADDEAVLTPKAVDPRPEPAVDKTTTAAGAAAAAASAGGVVSQVSDAISTAHDTVSQVQDKVTQVHDIHDGVAGVLGHLASSPMLWVAVVALIAVAFLWFKHHRAA